MSSPNPPSLFRLAAGVLLGVLTLVAAMPAAQAEVRVGAPFPELSAHALEGVIPPLAGQVVLVDFWATWCAPCKAAFPAYDAFQTEFAPRGFTVIGVSVDKKTAPYADFLKRLAPAFPTVRDGEQTLVAEVRPPAMPTCYLLDRKGTLRLVHSGFRGEADIALLRAEILRLLDEKP